MNGKCIDIGTIQCFLDGETSQDESLRIGHHIANCEGCARLLAVAEDENSFVFSALDREMNALVPTQRLWTRINDSIETERSRSSLLKQVYAFFAVSLLTPTTTSAAAVLVVFGLLAGVWVMRSGSETVVTQGEPVSQPAPPVSTSPAATNKYESRPSADETEVSSPVTTPAIRISNHSPKKLEQIVKQGTAGPRVEDAVYYPIPGEASYIKTIADLKETVDSRKDTVYTGSSRVAFERDLAVVNDSINRMQKVVKKNPRNQAARQVLYSAYQDKIDMLNAVAQKDELMSSVQ
jgi:hypothetical protein